MEKFQPEKHIEQIPQHPGPQPELQLPTPTPEIDRGNNISPELRKGIINDISREEEEEEERNRRIDTPKPTLN